MKVSGKMVIVDMVAATVAELFCEPGSGRTKSA